MTSLLEYHKIRLVDTIHTLETSEVYAPNRHLLPLLRRFLAETLPRLDLAPKRNQSG